MQISVIVFSFLVSSLSTARAQWRPASATQVNTTEFLDAKGSVTARTTSRNQYMRDSKGDVLVQKVDIRGRPISATLIDYSSSRKVYSLDYRTGIVTDRHSILKSATARKKLDRQPKMKVLGTEVVQGLKCTIIPIYDLGPTRIRVKVGKAWVALDYDNLVVKQEILRGRPGEPQQHIVRLLSNLDISNEPDRKWFAHDSATVANLFRAGTGK